ncbi:MAG: hypothetical protein JWN23_2957 [Rhodocyclales bacterium]|nr:hypothetical protein [Rhodocyclales bacterium]
MADDRRGGRGGGRGGQGGGRGGFQPPVQGGGRGGPQQAPQRGGHPPAPQRGGLGQPGRGGLPLNVPQHPPQGLAPMQQAPARVQPPPQPVVQPAPQLVVPPQNAWLRGPPPQQVAPAQQLAPMQQQPPRGPGAVQAPPQVLQLVPQAVVGGARGGPPPQQVVQPPAQGLAPVRAAPQAPAPRTFPRGFASEREFRDATRGLAEQARDGEVFVSGSSVTGHSYRHPDVPFHVASRGRDASDIDVGIASSRLAASAQVGGRGFPERGTRLGEAERRGRNNNRQHPIGVRVYDADSAADAVPDREVIVRPHTPERERRRPPDLDPPRGGGRGGGRGGRDGGRGGF